MADIYRALGGPWTLAAAIESASPTRTFDAIAECAATIGDEDDWEYEAPCPFAGNVTVHVYDDTKECFWYCPSGHENSVPWGVR